MFRSLLAFAAIASASLLAPSAASAGWADEEDGILFLEADEDGDDEWFVLQIVGDELEVIRYTYEDDGVDVDVDERSYELDEIEEVIFTGDNDVDGVLNYTDIPSTMYGSGGDDYLYGGSAGDDLFGGWGRDTLLGNGGEDLLDSGYDWEDNVCDGGPGEDVAYRNYNFSSTGFRYVYQQFEFFDAESVIYRMPRVVYGSLSRF